MGTKKRVLVVDDHPLLRAGLIAVISAEPDLSVCGEAGTAREARDLIRATQPDVVVLDLTLPDGNGLDLVKRLAGRPDSPRLLICSIHDAALFAQRALAAGAQGYIHKQEATTQVITAIRKVLAGQVYLNLEMTQLFLQRLVGDRHDGPLPASIDDLSDRELEVFGLIGQGLSVMRISEALHLSVKTIDTHRSKIKSKLNLSSSNELTRFAVQWILEQR